MSHYTMLYKYGKRTRDLWGHFYFFIFFYFFFLFSKFWDVFNKTIIPLARVGHEMIMFCNYSQ